VFCRFSNKINYKTTVSSSNLKYDDDNNNNNNNNNIYVKLVTEFLFKLHNVIRAVNFHCIIMLIKSVKNNENNRFISDK